jgi:hypothetical protein
LKRQGATIEGKNDQGKSEGDEEDRTNGKKRSERGLEIEVNIQRFAEADEGTYTDEPERH